MTGSKMAFLDAQRQFFAEADAEHFRWQTRNPCFAETERDLLEGFPLHPGHTVLEVGCGEGGNLVNMLARRPVSPSLRVGVDLFPRKLAFAREREVPARFVCADAVALPFRDAVFDGILSRDLLHHLDEPDRAVEELLRVCKPGGCVWVVEPNGRNPLIGFLGLLRPHERRLLRNSVASVRTLVERRWPHTRIEMRQPFPLYRMVLHYQYGLPKLGGVRVFGWAMNACERLVRIVTPSRFWAYIVVQAHK